MSFEFLAPDAASPVQGEALMRSPIEWMHRDAGARFAERAGWRVVAGYGSAASELAACRDTVGPRRPLPSRQARAAGRARRWSSRSSPA